MARELSGGLGGMHLKTPHMESRLRTFAPVAASNQPESMNSARSNFGSVYLKLIKIL
jgi:hypothetical protein